MATTLLKRAVGDNFSVVDCIKYDYQYGNNTVEQKETLLKIIKNSLTQDEYQKLKEM